MILMVFLVFKYYCTLVVSQNQHCQSSVTLPQCETFCKQYNLPIHYSHKESHCCCKDDIESSTPGYVVIWEEEPLLSQNKPSSQSSVYIYDGHALGSNKAFDGNLNQRLISCAGTYSAQTSWIQVDLLQNALISSARIYNRNDCCLGHVMSASILVSDSESFSHHSLCSKFESITTSNQMKTLHCAPDISGRYVRLQVKNVNLFISEMQVFGHYQ